jgi:hypothetical protein
MFSIVVEAANLLSRMSAPGRNEAKKSHMTPPKTSPDWDTKCFQQRRGSFSLAKGEKGADLNTNPIVLVQGGRDRPSNARKLASLRVEGGSIPPKSSNREPAR